ncbi:MAG: hypothetical protein E6H05_10580 [Bacillati bacterium ANGP1]|uniref:Nif3-like dinuclear metal center hexameric protein n=1 Tax=Candidatus Segetimicrobium genomatis TaxID=2569760 RepID=A0A537INE1_9BACT|nr:MAG: hypothetical protein E6H05_10580 [Terrabacteria group bacterium ANGP1]
MTTEEIMSLALGMSGYRRVPEDSAIFVPGNGIRKVLFGLDVSTAELQLAKTLGVDLVIAHHPPGTTTEIWKVFLRHVEFMTAGGVPEDAALAAVAEKVEGLKLRGQAANYDHVPSVARLLGIPFMNVHAPLDELGRRRMREEVDAVLAPYHPASSTGATREGSAPVGTGLARGHATVGDIVEALSALPEMRAAPTKVQLALGDARNPVSKVVVAHGAYTNGGYPVAHTCFAHGIDLVVYIHIDFGELQRLRAEGRGNLIVTGHLAGDSLGFTPFLRELRKHGLEVTTFSGAIEP